MPSPLLASLQKLLRINRVNVRVSAAKRWLTVIDKLLIELEERAPTDPRCAALDAVRRSVHDAAPVLLALRRSYSVGGLKKAQVVDVLARADIAGVRVGMPVPIRTRIARGPELVTAHGKSPAYIRS